MLLELSTSVPGGNSSFYAQSVNKGQKKVVLWITRSNFTQILKHFCKSNYYLLWRNYNFYSPEDNFTTLWYNLFLPVHEVVSWRQKNVLWRKKLYLEWKSLSCCCFSCCFYCCAWAWFLGSVLPQYVVLFVCMCVRMCVCAWSANFLATSSNVVRRPMTYSWPASDVTNRLLAKFYPILM